MPCRICLVDWGAALHKGLWGWQVCDFIHDSGTKGCGCPFVLFRVLYSVYSMRHMPCMRNSHAGGKNETHPHALGFILHIKNFSSCCCQHGQNLLSPQYAGFLLSNSAPVCRFSYRIPPAACDSKLMQGRTLHEACEKFWAQLNCAKTCGCPAAKA